MGCRDVVKKIHNQREIYVINRTMQQDDGAELKKELQLAGLGKKSRHLV